MKTTLPLGSLWRPFALIWRGLTALLAGIAGWITEIVGMRDDSKYGRALRRLVGSCFALMMVLLATTATYAFAETMYYRLDINRFFSDSYYDSQQVSRNVTFYSSFDNGGFVRTIDGKKTLTGVSWIRQPLGNDSLVCYSDGKKRGYFNKFTGEPVIKAKYDHAWVFSDGLASVDDGGQIKFIDAAGKVVIDPKIPFSPTVQGYVFHGGYCAVPGIGTDGVGLIDRQGRWALKPTCLSIESARSLWIVDNGEEKSVLDASLHTVILPVKGRIWIDRDGIGVALDSHVLQRYTMKGELADAFCIGSVEGLTYNSDELRYASSPSYNEEGEYVGDTVSDEPVPVRLSARCKRYEAEVGWYGLMASDGKIVTPPAYRDITAIGYDLYLCKDNNDGGVVLNGRGERVE